MAVQELVKAGTRNAFLRQPQVDRGEIEWRLRRANRTVGRLLGRIEWVGSLEAYIRRTAGLMIEGWTIGGDDPLAARYKFSGEASGRLARRVEDLVAVEHYIWERERSALRRDRVSPAKRLPVHGHAIAQPSLASEAACVLLAAAKEAASPPAPRTPGFAEDKYWRYYDSHWDYAITVASLPFLVEISRCFAAGLFAAVLLRRAGSVRTILIGRPRLRLRAGRLHADDEPAVLWPDGTGRWYWDGIVVPERIAARRKTLTAEMVARVANQELRRVVLERLGWERFLETAKAQLVAQDDFGKLWSTEVRLDGEQVQLVEVVNATAEPDGQHRRYFLRVPPSSRTAHEAVAWTFGFTNPRKYLLAAES